VKAALFAKRLAPLLLLLGAGTAPAQRTGGPPAAPPASPGPTANSFPNGMQPVLGSGLASLVVTVTDEAGMPLTEQAYVKLTSEITETQAWGTTHKKSEAQFDSLAPGDYQIEASAAGYETVRQKTYVMTGNQVYYVLIRLKGGADTSVIKPGQILAPKARKEAEKGLAALKSNHLDEARKHLESAVNLAPTNADVNFLLGFVWEQSKNPVKAEGYFVKATSCDQQNVRALTALGELRAKKGDYAGAIEPLEKALSVDKNHWRAHWILSNAYLHQQQYQKASDEAELAISTGKGGASGARVIEGQALVHLGQFDKAIEEFQKFLIEEPKDPAAAAVRELVRQLQSVTVSGQLASTISLPILPTAGPAPASTGVTLTIPRWKPPSIDDEKPVLARGVTCPAQQVIEAAGRRVKQLADDLARFDAIEDIVHQDLDVAGKPVTKETRKFDYQVEIEATRSGVRLREYRNGLSDQGDFPDHIATLGLPGLAFVFHPELRDDFEMTCEGLGDWRGQAAWLIYFRQRPDRASRLQVFQFTDKTHAVDLKGRAWIAAGSWQIFHLEADLMESAPQIQLYGEHQSVDYGPVAFKQKHTELWLPVSADMYLDFRRHRYYRRHSFGSYKLFSVDSNEKISLPKVDQTDPDPKPEQ